MRPVPVGPGLIAFKERLDAELLIVEMPPGRDPDEVILENPETWRGLVKNATPLLDYYFNIQARDLDLGTAQGKSELGKAAAAHYCAGQGQCAARALCAGTGAADALRTSG